MLSFLASGQDKVPKNYLVEAKLRSTNNQNHDNEICAESASDFFFEQVSLSKLLLLKQPLLLSIQFSKSHWIFKSLWRLHRDFEPIV